MLRLVSTSYGYRIDLIGDIFTPVDIEDSPTCPTTVLHVCISVVNLRQLERQHARERERSAQSMQVQEEQHKYDVGRLTTQLHDVEKDRNLLMVCV